MEMVILVGLPGSGKTTFRKQRLDATHVVISKDLIRNNRRPARRQAQLIDQALSAGRSIVVDNVNPTREERAHLIHSARTHGARVVGFWFESCVPDCLRRNAGRQDGARVPDVAIYSMAKIFHAPEKQEGFDELYRVRIAEPDGFVVEHAEAPHGA
jgi:predicted kinase